MFDWLFSRRVSNEDLERRVKALELEWEEMYDRFRRVLARISKRAERAEATEPEDLPAPRLPDDLEASRRLKLDQEIRSRRARVVSHGEG